MSQRRKLGTQSVQIQLASWWFPPSGGAGVEEILAKLLSFFSRIHVLTAVTGRVCVCEVATYVGGDQESA